MVRSKPGNRAAQRLEAVSKQVVSAVDSVHGQVSSKMSEGPGPIRRLVTGHDKEGKAIFLHDDSLSPVNPLKNDGSPPEGTTPGFTTIAKTKGFPDNSLLEPFVDLHGKKIDLSDQSGVTCRFVDFPPVPADTPDHVNFMHRTISVDFGVILSGKIMLILDSGEEKEMNEGDIVVQRGTNHAWKNPFSENCRMMFVLVPSVKVRNESTGEELAATDTSHLRDD